VALGFKLFQLLKYRTQGQQ